MADVMNGATRLHWYQFRIYEDGELMMVSDVPVWRRDRENTDDYSDAHPKMLERAVAKLKDKHGPDKTFTFVREVEH